MVPFLLLILGWSGSTRVDHDLAALSGDKTSNDVIYLTCVHHRSQGRSRVPIRPLIDQWVLATMPFRFSPSCLISLRSVRTCNLAVLCVKVCLIRYICLQERVPLHSVFGWATPLCSGECSRRKATKQQ